MSGVPPPPEPDSASIPPAPAPPPGSAPGPSARGEGLLETAVGVLTSPVATLRGLAGEPHVGWAVVVTVVLGVLSAASFAGAPPPADPGAVGPGAPPVPPAELRWIVLVGGVIFLPLFGLGALAVWSAILHGLARLFGGVGRYGSVFTTVGFAGVPQAFTVVGALLSVSLGLAGDVLSGLLNLGLAVWSAVLTVLAVRESHRLSTGKAIATFLIPVGVAIALGLILLVLIIALVIGGIGAALSGAGA